MGDSYIEVNTINISRERQEISMYAEKANQYLDELREILEVLNTGWEGSANAVFNQELAKDMEFLAGIIQEASKVAVCMGYAEQEYVKCENDVADKIASVRI